MSTQPNAYLRTKVMTAGPAELRLMLIDGAIRFGEQGRVGLDENNPEKTYTGISRCQKIVVELINSLRPEHDPALCEKLSALYTYLYTQLIEANSQRDPAIVDEVLKLLRFERETAAMLIEQLAGENKAGCEMATIPSATPKKNAPTANNLVGGRVSLQG